MSASARLVWPGCAKLFIARTIELTRSTPSNTRSKAAGMRVRR